MRYAKDTETGEIGIERDDGLCCFKTYAISRFSPQKRKLIFSNDIEDLYDAYVIERNGKRTYYKKSQFAKLSHRYLQLDIKEGKLKAYAATWHGGGLRYVASMNEEGYFKLI